MPSLQERLDLARRLLADNTTVSDAVACHLAYYASAHHIAACLGRALDKEATENPIGHTALGEKARRAARAAPERRGVWLRLTALREWRERADYRLDNPPSHREAAQAVAAATQILATR